ncbi:AEC family transporter [Micromonospora sp. NPDC047465]|uniref:AEC family transporter n=1 Tax=Micromonospora sp. NPDC047465 TaxID=3154813 RepID=UPI0033E75E46
MHLVVMAVVPIVLLLGLGTVLRRRLVTDPGFWRGIEWMSYRVFTPALFVTSIAAADLTAASPAALLPSLAVPVVVVSVLVIALRRPLRANGPQLTSLVQGSIRINTYIGLVFASAAFGPEGVATFALAAAVMVPLVNVISVSVLSRHGDRDDRDPPTLWRELLGNPLIQGCVAGLALSLLHINLPAFLATTLDMLAAPALVCGTLAAGAAITFRLRRRDVVDVLSTSALKLVALPLAAVAIATALGVSGATLTSIAIICAVPTAPSAYVLARRMGGDTHLIASITGAQTLLSIATLPFIVGLTTG